VSPYLSLLVVATIVCVGVDASRLGVRRGCRGGGFLDMSVFAWVVACLLVWFVALPCYLVARPKYVQLRRRYPVGELPDLRPSVVGPWGVVPPTGSWQQGYAAAPNPYAAPANPYAAPTPSTGSFGAPAVTVPPPGYGVPADPYAPPANPYAPPGQPVANGGARACPACGAPGNGYFCVRCGTQIAV
jgi:hypothetical protein